MAGTELSAPEVRVRSKVLSVLKPRAWLQDKTPGIFAFILAPGIANSHPGAVVWWPPLWAFSGEAEASHDLLQLVVARVAVPCSKSILCVVSARLRIVQLEASNT